MKKFIYEVEKTLGNGNQRTVTMEIKAPCDEMARRELIHAALARNSRITRITFVRSYRARNRKPRGQR